MVKASLGNRAAGNSAQHATKPYHDTDVDGNTATYGICVKTRACHSEPMGRIGAGPIGTSAFLRGGTWRPGWVPGSAAKRIARKSRRPTAPVASLSQRRSRLVKAIQPPSHR